MTGVGGTHRQALERGVVLLSTSHIQQRLHQRDVQAAGTCLSKSCFVITGFSPVCMFNLSLHLFFAFILRPLIQWCNPAKPPLEIQHVKPSCYCFLQKHLIWDESGAVLHCFVWGDGICRGLITNLRESEASVPFVTLGPASQAMPCKRHLFLKNKASWTYLQVKFDLFALHKLPKHLNEIPVWFMLGFLLP